MCRGLGSPSHGGAAGGAGPGLGGLTRQQWEPSEALGGPNLEGGQDGLLGRLAIGLPPSSVFRLEHGPSCHPGGPPGILDSEKGRGAGRCQRAEVSELGGLAWGPRGLRAPGHTPSWEADSRKGRAARLLSFRGARDILPALGHPAGAAPSGDWPSWGRGNSAMAPAIRERQQLWTLSSQRK